MLVVVSIQTHQIKKLCFISRGLVLFNLGFSSKQAPILSGFDPFTFCLGLKCKEFGVLNCYIDVELSKLLVITVRKLSSLIIV